MRVSTTMVAGALTIFACQVFASESLSGRVVKVSDGDTLILLDDGNRQHRIRLAQIDAPEVGHGANKPGQPFGQRSRESLSEIAAGQNVRADCETRDQYDRQICTIWLKDVDVNLEQIRRGMAWTYRRYAHDQTYYRIETEAKHGKRGLWADKDMPTPPWEWRKTSW